MHEHITPVKTYLAVFATLIVLTFTTVLVSFDQVIVA